MVDRNQTRTITLSGHAYWTLEGLLDSEIEDATEAATSDSATEDEIEWLSDLENLQTEIRGN